MSDEPKNAKTDPVCSDEEALRWLRDGAPELVSKAMECLYRRLLDAVQHWVVSKNGSRNDGHDALTDALTTLTDIVQRGKYRDEGKLDHFLFRIAQYKFYDMCRKRGKSGEISIDEIYPGGIPPGVEDDPDAIIERDAEAEARRLKMEHCLDKIGARCKERLVRYWFMGQSHAEIAEAMGDASVAVSRVRKGKCQGKLESCMKQA